MPYRKDQCPWNREYRHGGLLLSGFQTYEMRWLDRSLINDKEFTEMQLSGK